MSFKDKFNKSMKDWDGVVNELPEDTESQAMVIGAVVVGYIVTSLTYFSYKGTKLAIKAIKNRH